MISKNEKTLAALLREALNSVAITNQGPNPIDPKVFRQMVLKYRHSHQPDLRFQIQFCAIKVCSSKVKRDILSFLRDELRQFLRGDRTYAASYAIVGGSRCGASLEVILDNLVKSSVVFGPDQAASNYYEAIDCGSITYQEYYLLTGIRTEKEIQVLDGITLMSLPNDSSFLPNHLPSTLRSRGIDFTSKTLLRMDISVYPLLHPPDEDYTKSSGPERHFRREIRGRAVEVLDPWQFAKALTLVGNHAVESIMGWRHLDSEHIFHLNKGFGGGFWNSSLPKAFTPSTLFSDASVGEAIRLYVKLAHLPREIQQRLEVPINRWMKSMTQIGLVDKMIDLGIAMESFLLSDMNRGMTFRFGLRATLLLEDEVEARRRCLSEFRAIYKYRSDAVHRGALPTEAKVNGENVPMGQFIERSQELFKRCLLKVIESGQYPNWTEIELGGVG